MIIHLYNFILNSCLESAEYVAITNAVDNNGAKQVRLGSIPKDPKAIVALLLRRQFVRRRELGGSEYAKQ